MPRPEPGHAAQASAAVYEHRTEELLAPAAFAWRVARHALWALAVAAVSLAAGVAGFHFLAELTWLDALLNASMLLGGMGPVGDLGPPAGKLFASLYALYAGLVFLIVAGLLFAPLLHRVLHRFHLDTDEGNDS